MVRFDLLPNSANRSHYKNRLARLLWPLERITQRVRGRATLKNLCKTARRRRTALIARAFASADGVHASSVKTPGLELEFRLMKRSSFGSAFLTMCVHRVRPGSIPITERRQILTLSIKDGTVYDGTGAEPKQADVAIRGDRIAGIGDFKAAKAKTIIDARGLAVAPGFINMLSWSTVSLIQDGRSQSEIRQGVTTEIMGEGESMGPVNDRVREHMIRAADRHQIRHQMEHARGVFAVSRKRGVSCNVASFIGATTIRDT